MEALGWGVLAGVLLLLVAVGAWWYLRAGDAAPAPVRMRVEDDEAPSAPDIGTASGASGDSAADAASGRPEGRALLLRLYALAFDDAGGLPPAPAPTEAAAHDAIAAACTNLLARTQFQSRHLPRRPQLLPKLMRAINDPDVSLELIARIVGEDPALSANLLRIANSPFYRIQEKPVESLMRAATLLGLDGLRPVIAAALVQPVMQTGDGVFGRLPVVIWEHTQLAADFASGMVRGGRDHEDAFAAQMLGLLHGMGSIIVAQVLRDNYALHPHLRPDARVITRVLDELAAPMAQRIAVSWELSERIGAALEAQRLDAVPADPLGRVLCAGRVAAALAMLCRNGRLDRDEGRTMLVAWAEAQGIDDAGLPGLWERLLP